MATDVVFVATPADTAINSTSDVTIVTHDVATSVGDQLYVDGSYSIVDNFDLTTYTATLDFDALFDIEIAFVPSGVPSTNALPFYFRGVLDIRAANLCYGVWTLEQRLGTPQASGTDSTMATTHLRGMGWGTSASNASGTTTVALKIRSSSATATQTLLLHRLVIRRTPVPAAAAAVPWRSPYPQLLAH